MDLTIFVFLLQDGLTNGAIYALLGLALVLVFSVTRVILIPQGEFVAFGGLAFALLATGKVPMLIYLSLGLGFMALVLDLWRLRALWQLRAALHAVRQRLALPALTALATWALAGPHAPLLINGALALGMVVPLGPNLYRVAFEPLAGKSVLTLLVAAVGVHLALEGLGLLVFGAEGFRAPPLSEAQISLGPLTISGQSIGIFAVTALVMIGLWFVFSHTLAGKALRATAINRTGARLVGISATRAGEQAFGIAAFIGALSGILIAPVTTLYYDTGFIIGLKGFVAAILGALTSFPLTVLAAAGVGIAESVTAFFASDFKDVVVFSLILPVLLLRSLGQSRAEDEE